MLSFQANALLPGQAQPSWTLEDFQLLCQDGSRAAVSEWRTCHLARVPAHAVITRQDVEGSLIFEVLDQGQVSFRVSVEDGLVFARCCL